jgi:dihydrofolate reductase
LTDARLIDEYQIAMCPIMLGGGKSMFYGIKQNLSLKLNGSRSFQNGNVFLTYQPA